MSDWPQVGHDAQHTGYTVDNIGANTDVSWRHIFTPEARVHAQVQAIVSTNGGTPRVYVPTIGVSGNASKLYALSTTSDATASGWSGAATLAAPVNRSAAADGTNVYVVTIKGQVYAFKEADGTTASGWTNPVLINASVHAAPVLADGQLFIVDANGYITSLDPADGSVNWQLQITQTQASVTFPVPLLCTPAHDGTRLIVIGQDNKVRAVNTSTQATTWTSSVMTGMGCVDYYPVVIGTQVVIRIRPSYLWGGGPAVPDVTPHYRSVEVGDFTIDGDMTSKLADLAANPTNYAKTMYVFNGATGAETDVIHYQFGICMHGVNAPVCKDADGYAIMAATSVADRGVWVRLNLTTGHIVDWLNFTPVSSQSHDETMAVSACGTGTGRRIVVVHTMDILNAQDHGVWNQQANTWAAFSDGPASPQLTGNIEAGLANASSIYTTWLYHIARGNQLIARNTA